MRQVLLGLIIVILSFVSGDAADTNAPSDSAPEQVRTLLAQGRYDQAEQQAHDLLSKTEVQHGAESREAAEALDLVTGAELDCKTTGMPANEISGRALLRISQAARTATRRPPVSRCSTSIFT